MTADGDFQLGLVTAVLGTGLFAYYTPYRFAGCGDGARATGESCDDGNLLDGDGCSTNCRIEVGFSGCTSLEDCVPTARCDDDLCVARCLQDEDCVDNNPCTANICNSQAGSCESVASGALGECAQSLVCSGPPTNVCVECVSDAQCTAPTGRCEVLTNTCVVVSRNETEMGAPVMHPRSRALRGSSFSDWRFWAASDWVEVGERWPSKKARPFRVR
ncbi:MAG: hypothetical protein HC923_01620 [Myxococcales bacterium]|nr:hypothetical protein [Myxococcales bacterium]